MGQTRANLRAVRVARTKRLANSRDGNPRYEVEFSDGTLARTESDASLNYDVENKLHSQAVLDVQLSHSGKIEYWRLATEAPEWTI